MLTITFLFVLGAFITLLFHVSTSKPPLWVTVLLLVLIHLLAALPLR